MTSQVALFVTCLVDLMRPRIGFAAIRALEAAGCEVVVPEGQTCCGQPALNSGDRDYAAALAKQTIAALEPYEAVVVPSGSCAGTIRCHYPEIFEHDAEWLPRAQAVAAKTFEIMAYLDEVLGWKPEGVSVDARATYHDSCSGLRELGIKAQPRKLLGAMPGVTLKEMPDAEICCGFGGTFCVKYPDISTRMVTDKTKSIASTGADTLLAGDMGCLLNMAGRLKREGTPVKVRHIAEVLAGRTKEAPAIGDTE